MTLLSGKVAIVTGGGRGIGRATCLAFAREGARVVVNDSEVSAEGTPSTDRCAEEVARAIVEAGGEALVDTTHVCSDVSAAKLVRACVEHFGRLDIVINNAGILANGNLLSMTPERWDAVLAAELSGYFHLSRHAAQRMKEQGEGGAIVNTTSRAGLHGNFGQSNYSAASAGVYGLTRTAAVELQRYRIRVNAVAPLAKTRLTEELPLFHSVTSMRPEHVAPVHVFLASDLADQVSGIVVGVAGGKLSTYRITESTGSFKEDDDGVWTAAEIAEQWGTLTRSHGLQT